jgi:hypothetical protein
MQRSDDALRSMRSHAQLLGDPADTVAEVVDRLAAVQAQSWPAVRLAIRARTSGLTVSDVERAVTSRQVVRTWAVRGTLHLLPAADTRWMVGLLGPVFARAGQRRRDQLGLDDQRCERALAALGPILADGPLTRAEIIERLAADAIVIDPGTQAPAHLLAYASNLGLICQGPPAHADEPTYVLLDDWLSGVREHEPADPAAELACRYLAGHAVATPADFATWSGLPIGAARRAFDAIRPALRPTHGGFAPADADLVPAGSPTKLLGAFDPYLLGYRDRTLILDPAHARQVQAGGGMITPSALVGGVLSGVWKLDRTAGPARVTVTPFGRLPNAARRLLAAEADDIGRFLDIPTTLQIKPGGAA